jgi:exodeoxyribonuclease III
MRIISLNVNGVRSASTKGLLPWLARQKADVVCLQEIKAHEADLPDPILKPASLHAHFHSAAKKGYSGVGVYCRQMPDRIVTGMGSKEFDAEGRYLQVDFGNLSIVSLYVPSGASSEERQQAKFRFLDEFLPVLKRLRASGRELILCGDWNIAHQQIDLKNWRSNQKNSGFLPEERAWLTKVFDELGWVDVFRRVDQRAEQYTWWSNRGESWAKNVGWRLDYQIATPGVAATARKVAIYKTKRFSDHAPLTIDYEWAL